MKTPHDMTLGEITSEVRTILVHWEAQNCTRAQARRLGELRAALDAAKSGKNRAI